MSDFAQLDRMDWRARGFALGAMALLGSGALLGAAPFAHAQVSDAATKAIADRYSDFGGAGSFCGQASGAASAVAGGAVQNYQGCSIYYSADTGAKVMYGDILAKYQAMGGPEGSLGFPTNDESGTGDGVGRFNNFSQEGGAAIYWSPQTGAHAIQGKVLDAWRASGGVAGPFGYPTADMSDANGMMTGMFAGPAGTQITWSESAGTQTVPGDLAANLPGFKVDAPQLEGNGPNIAVPSLPSVPSVNVDTPNVTVPTVNTSSGINKWWGIPIGLAITAAAGSLLGLMGRRPATTVRVDRPVVTKPVVTKTTTVKVPEVKKPEYKAPKVEVPKTQPWTTTRPAYEAPKPAPAPRVVEREVPLTTGRHAYVEEKTVVMHGEGHRQADTEMSVTYENNAVGSNQRSWEDKSDSDPNR